MNAEGDAAAVSSAPPVLRRPIVLGCALFALLTAVYPFARAAFRVEVDYNEGWNIYNTARFAHGIQLYPVAYGWQTVNYPMLSFAIMAFLHRFTHDYLFTARVVSLLSLVACSVLAGAVVHHLCRSRPAAILTGFLTLGIFCTNADAYVGMDDPQLLAQLFFLLGFYLYIRQRDHLGAVIASAAIFVFAGNIKHNPLDFPLAVLIDLILLSWRRALAFSAAGLALAAASIPLNIYLGGPFFLTEMLAPRSYSVEKIFDIITNVLGPLLIPSLLGLLVAFLLLRDPRRRPAGLLFFTSLLVGSAFGGGIGVSVNTFFSCMIALAMVLGLAFADLEQGRWAWTSKRLFGTPVRVLAAPVLFLWLIIPAAVAGIANPVASLAETVQAQHRFDVEVGFLRQHPGPQICESLLRCYFAGQPYLYDPFNATRLIRFHKLDPHLVLDGLDHGTYSAVEMDHPLDEVESERFPAVLFDSIRNHYQPALVDDDVAIYVPKTTSLQSPIPAK